MTQKDWILLVIPILCNGVVVFILQKIFERRQLTIIAKQKYVSALQDKIDVSLLLLVKVIQTTGNDIEQINFLNRFAQSFADIHYYYQQNTVVLRAIDKDMKKGLDAYNRMQEISQDLKNSTNGYALINELQDQLRTLHHLLQKIQTKCINYKI